MTMTSSKAASPKAPRQARSRAALERVIDAATELYLSGSGDSFRLKDVADKAGIAVGSIYSRFNSKDEVIEAVLTRQMQRIAATTKESLAINAAPAHEDLAARVPWLVRTSATLLADNVPALRASMSSFHSVDDAPKSGKDAHRVMENGFVDRLMDYVGEFESREPRKAAQWSFTVFYSVTARYLGLGSSLESANEGEWDEILDLISDTLIGYLTRKVH